MAVNEQKAGTNLILSIEELGDTGAALSPPASATFNGKLLNKVFIDLFVPKSVKLMYANQPFCNLWRAPNEVKSNYRIKSVEMSHQPSSTNVTPLDAPCN